MEAHSKPKAQPTDSGKSQEELIAELQNLRQELAEARREAAAGKAEAEKYHDLLDGSLQGFFVHDNFELLAVSKAMAAMLGYESPDEVLALGSVAAFLAPEHREPARLFNEDRRAGREAPPLVELRCLRKDGSSIWIQSLPRVVTWEGRGAVQTVVVEITERKEAQLALERANAGLERKVAERTRALETEIGERRRTEEALRESHQRLNRLLDSFPNRFFYVDRDLRYREANTPYLLFAGLSRDELIGRHIAEVIGENALRDYDAVLDRVRRGERAKVEVERGEGESRRRVEVHMTPDMDQAGDLSGIFVSILDITDRIAAEQALRESRERLERFLDSAPTNVLYVDSELRFREMNARYLQLVGRTREELIGKPVAELIGGDRMAEYGPAIEKVMRGEEAIVEVERTYPALGRRYLEIHHVPDVDVTGQVVGCYISVQDITARKEMEQALRESREHLQRFLDMVPSNLLYLDQDLRYREVNARYLDFIGHTREELIGISAEQVLGEDVIRHYRPALEKVWRGEDVTVEVTREKEGSGLRHLEVHHVPDMDPSGNVVGCYISVQDVTTRKEVEQALRASRDRMRLVTDNLPVVIASLDRDLRYTFINRLGEQWFGRSADEVIGHKASELFPTQSMDTVRRRYEVALAGEAVTAEDRVTYPDGREREVQFTFVPNRNESGDVVGLFSVVADISERKAAEHSLRESESRMRLLTDAVPVLISYIDRDGVYRFSSATHARWLASTPEALVGRHSGEVLSPQAFRLVRPYMERAFAGERQEFEMELPYPDGKTRVVYTVYIPDIGPDGEVRGYSAMAEDITERRANERILRENESRMRLLTDAVPVGITYVDRERTFRFSSAVHARWLGYSPEEVVGRRLEDVLTPENHASFSSNFERALAGEHFESESEFRLNNGEILVLHTAYIPDLGPDGEVRGYSAMAEDITERRRAEEALRRSETLLQDAIESIPDGLAMYDAEDRLVLKNSAYRKMYPLHGDVLELGRSFEEMLRIGVARGEFLDAKGREEAWIAERMEAHRNPPGPIEQRLEGGRWLLTEEKRTKEGGTVGVRRDVTAIKLAQQALRENRDLMRLLTDAVPVTISYVDHEQRYRFSSAVHAKWMNSTPENIVGKRISEVVAPKVYEKLRPYIERALAGERLEYDTEVETPFPDGIRRLIHSVYIPDIGENGEVRGYSSMLEDITDRKRAEQALRESEARFKSTFENSPSLILLKDLEGRYKLVNPLHEKWHAIPADALIGKKAKDIYPLEMAEMLEAHDREVLLSGQPMQKEQEVVRLADGRRIPIINLKFPVRDSEGHITGLGVIATDISEMMALQGQLRESQKMEAVGQLAGGIAHDFNNLLQIIDGYAELALDNLNNGDRLPFYLRQIVQAGERAATLTRHLLTFSRKTVLRKSTIDVNTLINQLMVMLERIIQEDIQMEFLAGKDLPPVSADRALLEQVVLNLCINARDAMEGGGRLELETARVSLDEEQCERQGWERPGDYIRLIVRDNGCGIPREIMDRIFEPFFTSKEVGKGTGLGLSMAHSIVRQHQGMIQVQSEEGEGTTFEIYLPAAASGVEKSAEAEPEQAPRGREIILIAEDEEYVRAFLSDLLASQGYRVLAAADGHQAVQLFEHHAADIALVILDVVMPGLKGTEAHRIIHELRPEVPVVFSTGYSDQVIDAEYLERYGLTMLQKPYAPRVLFDTVRSILDRGT